jgi:DNA modification methylase
MITELREEKDIYGIEVSIKKLIDRFEQSNEPIEVSFRELIPELKNKDRFTHLIHAYPAKLLMHIPYFFLNNEVFSKVGETVLDPFCGTGTVLLESILAGRNAIGADANPLARLIAKVKVTMYDEKSLYKILEKISEPFENKKVTSRYPDVINIDYWFSSEIKNSLLVLKNRIFTIENVDERDFFLVCFSNLIKKVSYADPRVSVPVRLNPNRYEEGSTNYQQVKKRIKDLDSLDVIGKFTNICKENINRFEQTKSFLGQSSSVAEVIARDARNLTDSLDSSNKIKNGSVDLIITSPPYAGAQKYIRSSSLNLGWLDLATSTELKYYDSLNIGRENFSKSNTHLQKTEIKECDQLIEKVEAVNFKRAQIVSSYIVEMQAAIRESVRVLKKGGYFVLIVGNNKVCDLEFNTQKYLTTYMEQQGLELILKLIDDIKSYGLMTKRNKTADIISREWVLIFKKN